MSEYEPITGELREAVEWCPTFCGPDKAMVPQPEFDRLCDAIDAVHAGLKRENAELRAKLDNCADSMHDGWVRLPVDEDGEVIHVGDAMERGDAHGRVIALMLSNYPKKWGGGLHWGIQLEGEHAPTALDSLFRHYHIPTVEDVLREMLYKAHIYDKREMELLPDLIAEYAAKLRLAEGEDE